MRTPHLTRLAVLATVAALPLSAMAQTPAKAPDATDPEKKICRRMGPAVGSNLPGKRTCMTAEQWRAYDQTARDNYEQARSRMPSGRVGPNRAN